MDTVSVSLRPGGVGAPPPADNRDAVRFLFCFVFPTKPTKRHQTVEMMNNYRLDVLDRITAAGLVVELFYSVQQDEIYVKVGASDNRLLAEADIDEHKLELDAASMRIVALSDKDQERAPIHLEIPYDKDEKFDAYNHLTRSWTVLTDDQVDGYMKAQTKLSPYDFLFARYNDEWESHHKEANGVQIYKTYSDGSILRAATRIKLIQTALERTTNDAKGGTMVTKGAGLNLGHMVFRRHVLAAFPLKTTIATPYNNSLTLYELHEKWSYWWKWPWTQPIDEIRDYFGEAVAIYFEFLGHYTFWLGPAGIVGFAVFLAQVANVYEHMGFVNFFNVSVLSPNDTYTIVYTDLSVSPFYALFVSLWASFMLEFWKRKQARFALKYGMVGYEQEESIRPEFLPSHHLPNPVTGKRESYLSEFTIWSKISTSISIVLFCVMVVMGTVGAVFVLKVFLSLRAGLDENVGGYLALLVNAVAIQVLGAVYQSVAEWLNDWENHKTDTTFEDALIAKTFVFAFVNSYSSLFYIAFVKTNVAILGVPQYCNVAARQYNATDNCFGDLGASLLIIFGFQIVSDNTLEILIPSITGFITSRRNTRIDEKQIKEDEFGPIKPLRSPAEDQFYLETYESTIDDFLELAVQFGYATMFVTAFPVAPFLAFVNNWIEVRVDAYKLCKLCRRPEIKGAEDIGNWQYIFETVGFIAVVTNSGVMIFTSTIIADVVLTQKNLEKLNSIPGLQQIKSLETEEALLVWLFIIFFATVSGLKTLVAVVIPDVPQEVEIQKQRNDYLVRKCLLLEPDDDDDMEEEMADPTSDTGVVSNAKLERRLSRRMSMKKHMHIVHDADPDITRVITRITASLVKAVGKDGLTTLFDNVKPKSHKGLSKKEFTAVIKNSVGVEDGITTEEIETMFVALDTTAHRHILKEEFVNLMRRTNTEGPASS